jgi:hypothetical protein
MVDIIFDQCVFLLVFLAGRLGMTYKAINVWIFVVIWPICTLTLIAIAILQQRRIRRFLAQGNEPGRERVR